MNNGLQDAFASPPSPIAPAMVLLSPAITPAVGPNVDFATVFQNIYDNYRIYIDGVIPSATTDLRMQFFNSGVIDTASVYFSAGYSTISTNSSQSNAFISSATFLTGSGSSTVIDIMNVNDPVNAKQINSSSISQSSTAPATYTGSQFFTQYATSRTCSGVRFFWNSGANFTATGKIRVYGFQN